MPEIETRHLFAIDALNSCVRCLEPAGDSIIEHWQVALAAIDTVWDVAPPAETWFRDKPTTPSELYSLMHEPIGRWLPYSGQLGDLARMSLAIDGTLNLNCKISLSELGGLSNV